jgi:hypothetical protein
MGGSRFDFEVLPSATTFAEARKQRLPILERLFRHDKPEEENELRLAKFLEPLRQKSLHDFRRWLDQAAPHPWEATTRFIAGYLSPRIIGPSQVSVQPEGKLTKTEVWSVSICLSGCAGMANVSSLLASHWMDLWFLRNPDRIARELLLPVGLTLGKNLPERMLGLTFVPTPCGYAMFYNGEKDETGMSPFLAVDGAELEGREDAEEVHVLLNTRFVGLMRDGKCRCQLCMPDFDIGQLRDMPGSSPSA